MKMPPGFQSLRDLQPWRHTLALSEMRLRVDAFPGMQVCAAEWKASERSGDDRSRRPFQYKARQTNRDIEGRPTAHSGEQTFKQFRRIAVLRVCEHRELEGALCMRWREQQ